MELELVRIARTIMAVLLAVAVAAMPAAASAMAAAATGDAAAIAPAAAMPADCPHHHAPADHGKSTDNGAATAACAVKCFTYAGTTVPAITMAPIAPQPRLLVSESRLVSNIAAPPFRPPRI